MPTLLEKIGIGTVAIAATAILMGFGSGMTQLHNARKNGTLPSIKLPSITRSARYDSPHRFDQDFSEKINLEKGLILESDNGIRTIEFLRRTGTGYIAKDRDGDGQIDQANYLTEGTWKYGNLLQSQGERNITLKQGRTNKEDEKWDVAQRAFDYADNYAKENKLYVNE